jgi:ATP-dependent Clp protease adaptor protein ClpS
VIGKYNRKSTCQTNIIFFLILHGVKLNLLQMQPWEDNSVEILQINELDELLVETRDLVVFNDDVNTFDFVIQTLIEVCNHTPEQAEQCTLIIHYRGKCSVKKGSFEELRPMRDAITERGIGAAIV